MQTQAGNIQQPAQRKSFFEQVEVNRVVVEAWAELTAASPD